MKNQDSGLYGYVLWRQKSIVSVSNN